ncbi:hypothetical protein [Nocardia sp. NPDC004722]
MVTTLVAGLAGVLGVAVGKFWDTRSESTRWRRNERTASYRQLIDAFLEFRLAITHRRHGDAPDHDWTSQRHAWVRSLAALWLYGSDSAVSAGKQLDIALTDLVASAQSTGPWNDASQATRDAFDQFVQVVRTEFRLPDLTESYFDELS